MFSIQLIQAVQFLHDLGAVQFFDTDFLREMIVIYPQWIVDVMACLVTVHEGAVKVSLKVSIIYKLTCLINSSVCYLKYFNKVFIMKLS